MRKIKIMSIIVFCVMLFGGAIVTMTCPKKAYSTMENRKLEQKPEFAKSPFWKGAYQEKYEKYLSDQFFLRDNWVDLAVNIQKMLGKKDINDVYLGKDSYLLEKEKEDEYDKDQVAENVKTLSSFVNDMCEMFGEKQVSCLMIPSKTLVLSEYLPAFSQVSEHTEVLEALRKSLLHPDRMLYLKDMLKSHQQEYIYYRTDHHWTTLGAYYAFVEWAKKSGQANAQSLKNYDQEVAFDDFYGTTYNKVHVNVPKDRV
ncbi:MAG: DHHW family protein, partial [Eubacterium sp.]